jgi:MFS family permease
MMLVVIVCGVGVWPASYVVSAETSSLHLRGKAQGIGWFGSGASTAFFGFVLPYIFNPDQGNLRAKTGWVFAGLCAVAAVVSFFVIPEMKGRTPAEIDEMFELRLPTREFRRWNASEGTGRGGERTLDEV